MLHLQVMLESDAALLGSDYEYAPFVKTWATWGKYRLAENYGNSKENPLKPGQFLALPPFQLPPAQASRLSGDEMVHMKLQTQSRHSGIASIDAQEHGQQPYEVQDGKIMVTLADLLTLTTNTQKTLRVAFVDGPLLRGLEQELAHKHPHLSAKEREARAGLASCKGTLVIRARMDTGTPASVVPALTKALQQACRLEQEGKRLVYGSPLFFRALQNMQTRFFTEYSTGFYGQYSADGSTLVRPPTYALGKEKTVQHMHMPLMPSEFGDMHPVALGQHRIEQREGLWQRLSEEERKYYGVGKDAALVVEKSLASSCLRAGMTNERFLDAVRAQHTQSHTDPAISADYLTATMVIADVATARGNNLAYMKDLRYPNRVTLTEKQLALLQGQTGSSTTKQAFTSTASVAATLVSRIQCASMRSAVAAHPHGRQMMHGRRKMALFLGGERVLPLADGGSEEGEGTMLEVEVESMDAVGVHGKMGVDDCEGSAQVCTDLLRALPLLQKQATVAEAPMLHAACQVAAQRMVFECVSSVSAAFVDTSGAELSKDAQRAMKDLPMIGDEQVCVFSLLFSVGSEGGRGIERDDFRIWNSRLPNKEVMMQGGIDANFFFPNGPWVRNTKKDTDPRCQGWHVVPRGVGFFDPLSI